MAKITECGSLGCALFGVALKVHWITVVYNLHNNAHPIVYLLGLVALCHL